jgi:hypothetical protein
VRGRLSGVIGESASELVASYDGLDLGGLGPYPLAHEQHFSFPIPPADLVPASGPLLPSDDDPSAPGPSSAEVRIPAVPEPSTWAAWGLIGCVALVVRRRRRA